jgi:L-ascorbate metabolism protein UlaG (beta-lactamase superfamily)
MFDIEYKGGNSIVIATKKTILVVDPKLSVVGLKDLAVEKMVQLATESRFIVEGEDALRIDGPGEYEASDFSIKGMSAIRHIDAAGSERLSTIYRIEVGETRIVLLGNIASQLSEEQLEEIGVVDIVILPVGGGGYTLDATSAVGLVRQIDPKVVVPIHFADPALHYEVPQESLDVFLKELGVPIEEAGSKYKVKGVAVLPTVLTVIKIPRS